MRTRRLRPLGRSHVAARKRSRRKRELSPLHPPRGWGENSDVVSVSAIFSSSGPRGRRAGWDFGSSPGVGRDGSYGDV